MADSDPIFLYVVANIPGKHTGMCSLGVQDSGSAPLAHNRTALCGHNQSRVRWIDNRGGGIAAFWLASAPMTVVSYPLQNETSFTQKAWNTRSYLVLSLLERRVPGRA